MELNTKTTAEKNEDVYQKLANDIIWRLNLVWNKTFDVIYEYIKNNIQGLDDFNGETVSNKLTSENNESSDYWRIYKLIQNGSETNCLLVSYNYKGSAKFFPIKVNSISRILENVIETSQSLMTFRMEVPKNGDKTKTWCFTKQIINCIGAFEEQYKPLEDRIETSFFPLEIYERALEYVDNYDLSLRTCSGDRELASCDDDFVKYPIFKTGFDGHTIITATKANKEGNYVVVAKYADGKEDRERISAESLYEAYIMYMEKHGYYGMVDSDTKHMVYQTENKD